MNCLAAISNLFTDPAYVHAAVVLTVLAPVCAAVGYLLVIRNEVFAADALSHVGFTGSLAALAFGLDQRLGLFGLTITAGLAIATLGKRARVGDTTIGVFFTWILGTGVLFLALFNTHHSAAKGNVGPTVLFGSLLGITTERMVQSAVLAVLCAVVLLAIARPLLFATIDTLVAAASGVPVRAISLVFVTVLAIVVAEAVQVVGALLVLGLVATPAATVARFAMSPYRALVTAAALALSEVWVGLVCSALMPEIPPSVFVISVTTAVYAASFVVTTAWFRSLTVGTRPDEVDAMSVELKA